MRFAVRAFIVAALGSFLSPAAHAQSFVYVGPSSVASNVPVLPQPGYSVVSYGAPRVVSGGKYLPLYDYGAAPYPLPARIYSGYGQNDFAFYGQAYGHPYEPWTWAGLSRYPAYPPIRVSGFVGP